MANPNNQSFFVPNPPDLDQTLASTLAAIIDQRVNLIISHRLNDYEQRLQNIEQLLRGEGRLVTGLQPTPQQPRQSPLRTQHQQQVQQAQQQQAQQQQVVQQQVQQQQQQQQQVQQQQQQQQQHHNPHQHPHQVVQQQQLPQQQQQLQHVQVQQQPLPQFQPSQPPPPQNQNPNQNGVDIVNDPVMALANANGPGSIGTPSMQHQQQLSAPTPSMVNNINPVKVPMEIPPEGYPISSRATMQQELDLFTIPRGYSMRMSGTRDMGKGKRKIRWICFRAGEPRYSDASKASGQPERSSKKCNCPFKFECVETFRDSNLWVVHHHITPGTTTHNHPPSDPTEDPRSRKLPANVAAEVDGFLRAGWQVSKIMQELKNRGFKNVLSRDMYNRRQQLKRDDEGTGA